MDASRNPGAAPLPQDVEEIDLTATSVGSDLHDPDQRRFVESQLTSIPGVLAARVVPGFDRQIDELHIVTSPERGPKATVRDAQTVLLARCSIPIDHRVISVVQVDDHQLPALAPRVRLLKVGTVQAGMDLIAEVTLGLDGQEEVGRAEGVATTSGLGRAVAAATLRAFDELVGPSVSIELRDTTRVEVGGQLVALTVLELRDARGDEPRSGTAVLREVSGADAVARSVLDALNRSVTEGAAS
ncbi:MAG: hypothetical protein ACLFUG_01815 [Nitriliruptoraceae bacterium]